VPAAKSQHAVVDQIDKTFVPQIAVVQTGTAVEFPNSDNIRHQVYSFSPAKVFTLKLYSGRPSAPVVFDKPGLVVLGCNIHDNMLGYVLSVDTPWFARSAAPGTAKIADVPAGSYDVFAWHTGATAPIPSGRIEVGTGAKSLSLRLDVQSTAALARGTLPES